MNKNKTKSIINIRQVYWILISVVKFERKYKKEGERVSLNLL